MALDCSPSMMRVILIFKGKSGVESVSVGQSFSQGFMRMDINARYPVKIQLQSTVNMVPLGTINQFKVTVRSKSEVSKGGLGSRP